MYKRIYAEYFGVFYNNSHSLCIHVSMLSKHKIYPILYTKLPTFMHILTQQPLFQNQPLKSNQPFSKPQLKTIANKPINSNHYNNTNK